MDIISNPLNKGVVGNNGGTLVTNFAFVNVQIGEFRITNLPVKTSEGFNGFFSDVLDSESYGSSDSVLASAGFNSYIKSFTCKRAVPSETKGFWGETGGSVEASVTVFDPTFVQFEEMVMDSVKTQKVYCEVTYGLSSNGSVGGVKPFRLTCLIKSATQSFSAAGVEWTLELGTVPPEYFNEYPEKGADLKKETVITIGAKGKYKSIGDAVVDLLEKENWRGVVIPTKPWTKKLAKIPTKDFVSRIQLVRDKLAPMAMCLNDNITERYHVINTLDGAVFFAPFGMTIKEALQFSGAITFGGYKLSEGIKNEVDTKSTIEQLNMSEYIEETDGALTLKYGFQNSVVQSFDIQMDPLPMVILNNYVFSWYPDGDASKVKTFEFPKISEKNKKDKSKKVKTIKIFLHDTNEEDARQTAKTIVRKLQVLNYKGSATLINFPYLSAMQQIRFEYMIPNGARMAKKLSNNNKPVELESDYGDKTSERYLNNVSIDDKMNAIAKNNLLNTRGAKNKTEIAPSFSNQKQKNQILDSSANDEKGLKSRRARGLKPISENEDAIKNGDFNNNVGMPTSLSSWTDTRGGSITYIIESITDTIESGIITTELQLAALFATDFPQTAQSLKS